MQKHSIATIINFCTNESRFISSCLKEALYFSKQVIVSYADHFFDGTPENIQLIDQISAAFPECLFIEYPFIPREVPSAIFKKVDPDHFWHGLSRLVGFNALKPEIETVLFLDADEVGEGERMQEWLDSSDYHQHTTLKMANYWYFRESCYRAESWEDSVVLAQKRALSPEILLHQNERTAVYDLLPHPKRPMVTGTDGVPLFHHYSWVRTQEEMLRKVKTWGHRKDRDWEKLVQAEFTAPFSGTDFIHGYRYQTVEPSHPISLETPTFVPRGKGKKQKISSHELIKMLKRTKLGKPLFFRFF
jgi:hypothetical protein